MYDKDVKPFMAPADGYFSFQNGDRSCEFRRCWFSPMLNQFSSVDPFTAGTKVRKRCLISMTGPPRVEASADSVLAVVDAWLLRGSCKALKPRHKHQ